LRINFQSAQAGERPKQKKHKKQDTHIKKGYSMEWRRKVQTERNREISEQGSKGSKRKLIIGQFREAVSTATITWHRMWEAAAV
jgi:hypothetical protein